MDKNTSSRTLAISNQAVGTGRTLTTNGNIADANGKSGFSAQDVGGLGRLRNDPLQDYRFYKVQRR